MKKICTIVILSLLPLLSFAGALDGVRLVASEVTICKGSNIDLSKYVESTPPGTTTVWKANNAVVPEDQAPTTTTIYTAIFTNGTETAQRTFRVNVVQPPVINSVSPTGTAANICLGSTVTLNATASNYSEIRWYLKGSINAISNGTTLPAFKSSGTFTYEVNALPSNEVCRLAASTTTVTVVNPTLSINLTGNQTKTICRGDKLTLNNVILVSTSPASSNPSVFLSVTKKEWKESNGNSVNADNPITYTTKGTYKYTVDVEASATYNTGTACGVVSAVLNNGKTLQRTVTVNVVDCETSMANITGDTVCEGSTVRFTINKGGLVFGWSNVAISDPILSFDSKTLVSEDANSIVFSIRALRTISPITISADITGIKYVGGGNASNASLTSSVTAKVCDPRLSSNTKACPGKNFTVNVNGNSNIIDSVQVTKATNHQGANNGELTAAVAKTKVPPANTTSYNFYLTPGDTTKYEMVVYYKVGGAVRAKTLPIQINPNAQSAPGCQPKFNYQTDSTCAGIEQQASVNNNGYSITNVTWLNTCGDPSPVATSSSNLGWKFTPTTSCVYKARITYTAGAQTKTVVDSFNVKVKMCKPLLQISLCHDNEPNCIFTPNSGSGGADGTIEQTFCSGQKVHFYLHHYMGVNLITSINWSSADVKRDTFLIKDMHGNDSISSYWAQPTATTTYTATIGYTNVATGEMGFTKQSYTINSIKCIPPVSAHATWNGAVGNLCRGNEVRFSIPKVYKNNYVDISKTTCVTRDVENITSAGDDVLTFRAYPKSYGNLDFQFIIWYNTSLTNMADPQTYTIKMDSCTPTFFAPAGSCEGSTVSLVMIKSNLVFSRDSVTFSGSASAFKPKYNYTDNASQINYRIMAHNHPNNLKADVRLQNGEKRQVDFSVDGQLCEPYFTAPDVEVCPKTDFNIDVKKGADYKLDSVLWQENNLVKNAVDRYTGNLAYSSTFHGNIFYTYGDGTDTVHTWTYKEAKVKVFRQVFMCDDTTICRGGTVNLNSIIKTNVAIPSYIDTLKAPYFTDTFFIPARVADCTNPSQAKTVEESIVIIVDSAIWVASMKDTVMCLGDSITLNATGLGRFSWFSADSSEMYNKARPRVSPMSTTDYVVTVKNACGPKFDTAHVVVKTTPNKPDAIYGVRSPLARNYYTYFVEPDPMVDKYEWLYPRDWELNGMGNDSIKFRFSESPGQLSVTARNVCGLATLDEKIDVRKGYDIVVGPNPVSTMLHLMARSCLMDRIAVYNTNMLPMLPVVVFSNPQNEFTINVGGLYPNPYFIFVWVDKQKKPLVYKFIKSDKP